MSRRVVDPVRPRSLWAALLAPPIIGTAYFLAVYLAAEAACAPGIEGFATATLRVVIAGSTAVAAVALLCSARYAVRLIRERDHDAATEDPAARAVRPFLGATGAILVGLFAFFVAMLAAPAIGSSLC